MKIIFWISVAIVALAFIFNKGEVEGKPAGIIFGIILVALVIIMLRGLKWILTGK